MGICYLLVGSAVTLCRALLEQPISQAQFEDGIDRHVAVFTVTATDDEEESVVAQMTFNS